jgi:hypothetical protein
VGRAGDQHGAEQVVLDIAVIAKHASRRDDERHILVGRVAVSRRNRGIIDRQDREEHGRDIAVADAVVCLIRERV